MTIMDKARELGELLAQSDELVVLKAAETTMVNDAEAQIIVQEFRETRDNLLAKQEAHEDLTPAEEARVKEVEGKMENNPAIRAYLTAQDRLEQLLNRVHATINQSMVGGEDDGCSPDSCSSCSGGCS